MKPVEPFLYGGLLSYAIVPVAAFALGFEPSLSWKYAFIVVFLPILLAVPAVLPLSIFLEIVFGHGVKGRLIPALTTTLVGTLTFLAAKQWVNSPQTDLQEIALALSAPFVGWVWIALAATVVLLARFVVAGSGAGLVKKLR